MTRNWFLHDLVGEGRTGVETRRFPTFTLKSNKLVIDVAQLTIVVIKALVGQLPNSFIDRSFFGGLDDNSNEDWECFSRFNSFPGCRSS